MKKHWKGEKVRDMRYEVIETPSGTTWQKEREAILNLVSEFEYFYSRVESTAKTLETFRHKVWRGRGKESAQHSVGPAWTWQKEREAVLKLIGEFERANKEPQVKVFKDLKNRVSAGHHHLPPSQVTPIFPDDSTWNKF